MPLEMMVLRVLQDQLFYCRQRGIGEEEAVSMIVNGFCKEVFKELPMEYNLGAGIRLLLVAGQGHGIELTDAVVATQHHRGVFPGDG